MYVCVSTMCVYVCVSTMCVYVCVSTVCVCVCEYSRPANCALITCLSLGMILRENGQF